MSESLCNSGQTVSVKTDQNGNMISTTMLYRPWVLQGIQWVLSSPIWVMIVVLFDWGHCALELTSMQLAGAQVEHRKCREMMLPQVAGIQTGMWQSAAPPLCLLCTAAVCACCFALHSTGAVLLESYQPAPSWLSDCQSSRRATFVGPDSRSLPLCDLLRLSATHSCAAPHPR